MFMSAELPPNTGFDPLMGAFLADLANHEHEEHGLLSAA